MFRLETTDDPGFLPMRLGTGFWLVPEPASTQSLQDCPDVVSGWRKEDTDNRNETAVIVLFRNSHKFLTEKHIGLGFTWPQV